MPLPRPLVAIIRICPDCRGSALEPVIGGLGKMGRCHKCGYTGPLAPADGASAR